MLANGFIGAQIHLQVALELGNKESYYKLVKEKNVHLESCVKNMDKSFERKKKEKNNWVGFCFLINHSPMDLHVSSRHQNPWC